MIEKTPEEILAEIKKAVAEGKYELAPDSIAVEYDPEIQRIFRALFVESRGREPKRPIWCSDLSDIGVLFDWDPETKDYPAATYAVCTKVGTALGIEVSPKDLFVDAAIRLRSKESKSPKS